MSDGNHAMSPCLTVSIVSHGQGDLVLPLLEQLIALTDVMPLEILLTENLGERRAALPAAWQRHVRVLYNDIPVGFGANHNRAFAASHGRYFCVMNPDIRLGHDSILPLLKCVEHRPGVAGPRVVGSNGVLQDSARKIPGALRLAWRIASGRRHTDYNSAIPEQPVDWIAGMCLMFDRDSFAALGGFTEDFHLYCEDVDICIRMHLAGRSVFWVQQSIVVHDAQRDSHRSMRYLAWHLSSVLRLFTSKSYWKYRLSALH